MKKITIISIVATIILIIGVSSYFVVLGNFSKGNVKEDSIPTEKEEILDEEKLDDTSIVPEEVSENVLEEKKDTSPNIYSGTTSNDIDNSSNSSSSNNNSNTPSTTKTKTFTVSFDSNGGNTVNAQVVVENGIVGKPNTPSRYGYIFKNWLLNGKVYDFVKPITSNIILKADWKADEVPLMDWYKKDFNTQDDCDKYADTHFAGTYWYYCTPIKNYAGVTYGYMLRLYPFNDPTGTEIDLRPYN